MRIADCRTAERQNRRFRRPTQIDGPRGIGGPLPAVFQSAIRNPQSAIRNPKSVFALNGDPMPKSTLSSRERVRLALAHQETDRIPIAMVCAGINAPARKELEEYLGRQRGLTVDEYLDPLLDIASVSPEYVGPPLPPGCDIWSVRRAPISYGAASYDEIADYPLAGAETPSDLDRHAWPDPAMFDYSALPARIAAERARGDRVRSWWATATSSRPPGTCVASRGCWRTSR